MILRYLIISLPPNLHFHHSDIESNILDTYENKYGDVNYFLKTAEVFFSSTLIFSLPVIFVYCQIKNLETVCHFYLLR